MVHGASAITRVMQSSIVCNIGVGYFASDLPFLSVIIVDEDQEVIDGTKRFETPVPPSM